MAASASTPSLSEEELTLTVKWSRWAYTVRVCGDDSVGELKRRICELTNVLPKRQKLLYPKIGSKLSEDSLLLSQLPLKSSLKMTMNRGRLGSRMAASFSPLVASFHVQFYIWLQLIELWNPCRKGKKLLVLDIDYTLFDHRPTAENPLQLMRPCLHEFLTAVHVEFDIMIWSATRSDFHWIRRYCCVEKAYLFS